jgi:DNA-directed RNA polymerase subunit RPC12/RpoP
MIRMMKCYSLWLEVIITVSISYVYIHSQKIINQSVKGDNMRVVEIGNLAEREIECSDCKTILAYTPADVKVSDVGYEYVECPMCGEKLVVPYGEETTNA